MNIDEHPSIKRLQELQDFNQESAKDLAECGKSLQENPSSLFWRRMSVRCFAAHIEGITFLMKQAALELHPMMRVEFTVGEIAFLKEISFELNEKGEVEERQRFARFVENFRFACLAYARANHSSHKLSFDDDGFRCFRNTVKIRDRLMHPKSKDDLNISDEEDRANRKAWEWYQRNLLELFKDCIGNSVAYTNMLVEKVRQQG